MNAAPPVILWFRSDLRTDDNPALAQAAQSGAPVLPVYIFDEARYFGGGASKVYLHHSLTALNASLDGALRCFAGKAEEIIPRIAEETGAQAVYWNRLYQQDCIDRDKAIKQELRDKGAECDSFNGALLYEPWEIKTQSGDYYKVFTPFFRKGVLGKGEPAAPVAYTAPAAFCRQDISGATDINGLQLLPAHDWHLGMAEHFTAGEEHAHKMLDMFLEKGMSGYKENRNYPAKAHGTSRLSAALAHGEISPRRIWHSVSARKETDDSTHFLSEIGWREFSYTQLYYHPDIADTPMKDKFADMPWEHNEEHFRRWKKGETGVPIIDAAMRELWQTGFMHNRCRMIVASYLVKNLLIDWRKGERWFRDTLIDADPANNTASWQWVAGCGADAAPYFRIFNPETQSEKFDGGGRYIKRFVPALSELPAKYIHAPHKAPADMLKKAGVTLGDTYPKPLVDLKATRERALKAFENL